MTRTSGRKGPRPVHRARAVAVPRVTEGTIMDIGVVLQTTPPSARVVDLAMRAETFGFSHVWTFDSHILWQEPFPIYTQILAKTRNVIGRPDGHEPAHARLDGHGQPVRDPERDVRQPHRDRHRPGRLGRACDQREAVDDRGRWARRSHVIRELANGREVEYRARSSGSRGRRRVALEVWVAGVRAEGAEAGRRGRRRLHPAARRPRHHGVDDRRRPRAAEAAGRDPDDVTICVAAPAYVGDDLPHAREQCRWFGGMVGNHVADIVARYGEIDGRADRAHRLHRRTRGLRLQPARAGGEHPHRRSFPTRSSTASACSGRSRSTSSGCKELQGLGVDQFAVYLQHDAKDETLQAYGEKVIPAIAEHVLAKS